MPNIFPNVKDGDSLAPWMLNIIYRELERWRRMVASPPLAIDSAESSVSPPLLYSLATDELVPILTGSGGIAAGTYGSPGSATVTLLIEDADGPGFTASGADTATCYNPYTTALDATKFAWAKWRGPYLYLLVGDC
jgi:hypothetical protein